VPVRLIALVLDEVIGLEHLADVMVIGRDAAEQRVHPDRLGGRLGQRPDDDAVVVGSGGFHRQAPQQRVVEVRQLQEPDVGDDVEHRFQERQEEYAREGGEDSPEP
jgi:hypothetical protein